MPDFKLYYRAMVLDTIEWYWHKNRHIDQWKRIDAPEKSPSRYMTLDKDTKNTHWKKESFLDKWWWKNWTSMCKRLKLHLYLSPFTKNQLKMNQRP
jgi:hypothetical protein